MQDNSGPSHRTIGLVGLGKMGANLARRLLEKGWRVAGFNRTPRVTAELEKEGLLGAYSLEELVGKVEPPRVVWLMLPAGRAIDEALFGNQGLARLLSEGDFVIDGGNSFYEDSIRRYEELKRRGVNFVDVGVSGGPVGARRGACLMIGADRTSFEFLSALFADLAAPDGFQFFEGPGAGHFVKMVHNGIEYGMMQAMAEGFTLLRDSRYRLDLEKVADVYNRRSVIESRLMGWLKDALALHGQNLAGVSGVVAHTGEAEWTVRVARQHNLELKIIEESLSFRVTAAEAPSYTGKLLTALREQFGGHPAK